MSIRLMTAAWALNVSSTDKLVLLALADWSNDDGLCWPSLKQLCDKSGLSERAVRISIGRLRDDGHLTRSEVVGKGVNYIIHPGTTCPPAGNAPRHQMPETPARRAPNTPVTTKPQKTSSSSGKRAPSETAERYHRLPSGWTPTKALPEKLRAKVAEWPPGKVDDELEALHRWAANASNDRGKGRKLNWDIAWENWLDRADNDWRSKNGSVRRDRGSAPRSTDGFLNAIRESGERRRAANC